MVWWQEKPMRLIQTNLREIDVTLELDAYIDSLVDFSANALLFNVGGIAANYPTKLQYHYVNPNLKGDFTGEVLKRVHEHGMKFIARFDFSRLNEVHALSNPDWLYRSVKGEIVNYNGQVHTCINGYYQQEYSLKILKEVAENYPIDGVFFNMIGYITYDYSYNYHGICQCDNCKQRFTERTGHANLPLKEDANDPVFRDYAQFRIDTVKELFDRRVAVVKSCNPNIVVMNYTHNGSDIHRKESGSGFLLPKPEWNYQSTENVRTVHGSWDGMAVSNAAVHFVDFAMRHSAVSPHLTALRLAQNVVNGGWLDYYVIGTLINQDDRVCFDLVKDIYRFHKEYESYYSNLQSLAEICLVIPESSNMYGSKQEFRGIMRILSEKHVQYDLLHDSVLEKPEASDKLNKYKLIILADQRSISDGAVAVIDEFVRQGGKLLATGFTSTCDHKGNQLNKVRLESLGVSEYTLKPKTQGAYFRIRESDKSLLNGFEDIDLVYLNDEALECKLVNGAEAMLGLIPSCMFGPPEKCYITTETDIPGLVCNQFGSGKAAYLPWGIGSHYEKHSNHGHALLFASVLRDIIGHSEQLQVNASPLVEITHHQSGNDARIIISAVNLSGQLGTAFHAPLPIHDIVFKVKMENMPSKIHALRRCEEITFNYSDGFVSFSLEELELFETIVIEFEVRN